jgi:hypothetical protein
MALKPYVFRLQSPDMTREGLPHSEISGSKRACRSPELIATYYVLHRLLMPRHPLCALSSLTNKSLVYTFGASSFNTHLYAIVKDQSRRSGKFDTRILKLEADPISRRDHRIHPGPRVQPARPLAIRNPPRSAASEGWWACLESNQGPRPYQGRALTN